LEDGSEQCSAKSPRSSKGPRPPSYKFSGMHNF
jgi:hypothetical protein